MRLVLTLAPAETGTRVQIDTDLAVLGKIGEFGQPIIRKKADTRLEEFARHLRSDQDWRVVEIGAQTRAGAIAHKATRAHLL